MFDKDELNKIITKFVSADAEKTRKKKEENKAREDLARTNCIALTPALKDQWHTFVEKYATELADIMEMSKNVHKYICPTYDWDFNRKNYESRLFLNTCRISYKYVKKFGITWKVLSLKTFTHIDYEKISKALEDTISSTFMSEGDYFIIRSIGSCILFPTKDIESNMYIVDENVYPLEPYLNLTEYLNKEEHMKIGEDPIGDERRISSLLNIVKMLPDMFEKYKQELDDFIRKAEKEFDEREEVRKLIEAKRNLIEAKRNEVKKLEEELNRANEDLRQLESEDNC